MGSQNEPAPSEAPAPAGGRGSDFWGHAAVALQLALILFIVRTYEIGSRLHLFPVLCVAAGGFLVHALLPSRVRLAFFCALSLAVVVFVLGWPNGGAVIGIGAALIAACYLPVPFALRVVAVVLAGLILAVLRLDLDRPFWPVLGSMFMFRLIVYMYELRRELTRPPLGITVAYFFPFQNVCFLFFPIFDFKTFRDTYRAAPGWAGAQTGIEYIATGLAHVFAYRLVKYYLLPSPHQLGDVAHLALFLAANYALYLHASGYFHIITGLFHLFGFGVPRTHHNYFLASSFTDIWRRINIPWKEFMAQVFFFPAFFAARRLGTGAALVGAALWVFAMTWFLHSYQVFWITGSFPLGLHDAALWLVAGALVAANLVRDFARAREPKRAPDGSVREALALAARITSMFALVSVFWAAWNTPELFALVRTQVADARWWANGWWVVASLVTVIVAGAGAKLVHERLSRPGALAFPTTPGRSAIVHGAALAAVLALGHPDVARQFGPETARRIGEVCRESVTPVEAARAVRGYYEEITDAPVRPGAWLASLEGRPEPPRRFAYTDMIRPADDFLDHELIPNWSGEIEGEQLTLNRFGMRDRPDRAREKPPGTRRFALVGSSVVMGWGVGDGETFARLAEDELNTSPAGPRHELLNFGTGKSSAVQRRALIDRKVFGFAPDVVLYVAHQNEFLEPPVHLAKLVANGNEMIYPCLNDVLRNAGVSPAMARGEAEARLQPHAEELVDGIYRDLVAECRRLGVRPVWVYLPVPGVTEPANLARDMCRLAERSGFVVIDLSGWEGDRRPTEVKISQIDHHANALGHRLIAERLGAELRRRPELLGPP